MDRKRDLLAEERTRKQRAEVILKNLPTLQLLIKEKIRPQEKSAENAMLSLGEILSRDQIKRIKASELNGTLYIGCHSRAFANVSGGIAAMLTHASGISSRDAERLLEKREKIRDEICNGVKFISEAIQFFRDDNLKNFLNWLRENNSATARISARWKNNQTLEFRHLEGKFKKQQVEIPQLEMPNREHLLELLTG